MIHTFSVSNYFSIREEVVLDLRIPGTAPDLPRFRRSVARPDVRLPTVAVLMGPNGSGKTTLLRALTAMAHVASSASPSLENDSIKALSAFASKETRGEPTRLRLEIEADWLAPDEAPQLFRYEVALGPAASDIENCVFRYEALFHFPKSRPRRIFERGGPSEPIYVSDEISGALGLKSRDARLNAIQDHASVTATLALLNVPLATRITEWLQQLLASTNIEYHERWEPSTRMVVDMFDGSAGMKAWLRKHIQSSDLGIRNLEILNVDIRDDSEKEAVFFEHHGLDRRVPLHLESSGTKRLFHLLPQLCISLGLGVPAVLDEIDGDLHVDIVGEILGWFHSRETNARHAQLLMTSHNVGLLDDLEKEEVFIVEKTRDGATRVHGGQDVRGLRRDARLYPKYRAGVLGGIPKIG